MQEHREKEKQKKQKEEQLKKDDDEVIRTLGPLGNKIITH